MNIGENIKKARKESKITQKELAIKISKGFSTVQKYELGLVTPPLDTIKKIALALNTSVMNLMKEETPQKEYAEDMIELYKNNLDCWINDKAFNEKEKYAIKMHYCELMAKYKEIIERLTYVKYSTEYRDQIDRFPNRKDKIQEEYFFKSCDSSINDLVSWIRNMPLYISKGGYDYKESNSLEGVNNAEHSQAR